MKIELKLFASLRSYLPEKNESGSCAVETEEGTTIKDVLEQLDVPVDLCKIIFVNGVHAGKDDVLKDGDRLGVFPPVAGG